MYICTQNNPQLFFPPAVSQITYHSPVLSSPGQLNHLIDFFPKRLPSGSHPTLLFQAKCSCSKLQQVQVVVLEFSGSVTDGLIATSLHSGDSEHPLRGFRDRELLSRQKGSATAQLSHPPLAHQQERAGLGDQGHYTEFPQD